MWDKVVSDALAGIDADLEITSRGLVKVTPRDVPGLKVYVALQRVSMSVDRKVEVSGIVDVTDTALAAGIPAGEAFKIMLSNSVEINVKGLLRKRLEVRPWSELKHLANIYGPVEHRPRLGEMLAGCGALEIVRRSAPLLVEIHPELVPERYLEPLLFAPMKGVGTLASSILKEYAADPERLAWSVKMYLMYGLPSQAKKIRESYLLVRGLRDKLVEVTPALLR